MADYQSELPIRSQLPGQVLPDDVIIKIGDGTNPTTQLASVDTFGSVQSRIADASGDVIGSQHLAASYWLQVVQPANGPAAPGTASAYSVLAGGIYNATPPTLTDTQQSSLQLDSAGRLLVDAAIVFPYDTNYGTVDATTLRTAAQIGNASGAANFNYGAVGAQTLRVAAQIGNASGAADFGAGATDAQTLRVASNLYDGSGNALSSTSGALNSFITNTTIAVTQSTSPWVISGTVAVSNLPTTVDTNYGVVGSSTIRTASQIGNSSGAADFNNGATTAQTLRVAANLAVAGANVSVANPVPVTITSASSGTPIQQYLTSASLAAGASVTLTYTVPGGHTFSLERIWASASGKIKVVAQNGAVNIFAGFNSSAAPNIDYTVTAPPTIAAAGTVNVIITNEDKAAFDVYATVEGNQIT